MISYMLQINVSQMLREPIGGTRTINIDDEVVLDETCVSQIKGEARLTRTNRSVLARVEATTSVSLECARCLEHYDCPLSISFDEEYFPVTDAKSGLSLPDPEETEVFTIDERLTLDLTEAIRQYTLTAVPMKPLCKTECSSIKVLNI